MTGTAINTSKVDRRPIIEQCNGCDRVLSENGSQLCASFAAPETKWRLGPCSMATHIKIESSKSGEKQRVGQQKQKKR